MTNFRRIHPVVRRILLPWILFLIPLLILCTFFKFPTAFQVNAHGSSPATVITLQGKPKTVTTSTGVVTHGAIVSNINTIGWLEICDPSHTLADDPIAYPNQPGMSHLHEFWGNTSTQASSTYASMTTASNAQANTTYHGGQAEAGTSCGKQQYAPGGLGDTAAYWAPAVYVNGKRVQPATGAELYYRSKATSNRRDFEPIPNDARIIVGVHTATSVSTNPALANGEIYWICQGTSDTHYQLPPNNCKGGQILLNIMYPSCWDGQPMDHTGPRGTDDQHFAYAVPITSGKCPVGFSHAIPELSEKFKYSVGAGGNIQLSSDPAMPDMPGMKTGKLMPAYTIHADFWNTWQPAALQYLVTKCINAGISCGTNPITPIGGV